MNTTGAASSFNKLPYETLFDIASHLPGDDALSLSRLSSSLYNVCTDVNLYKAIVDRQHTQWESHSLNLEAIRRRAGKDSSILAHYNYFDITGRNGKWEQDTFSTQTLQARLGHDLRTWSRYAVADARIYHYCSLVSDYARYLADVKSALWFVRHSGHRYSGDLLEGLDWSKADPFSADSIRVILRCLPQLVIMKHPCLHSPHLTAALVQAASLPTTVWRGARDSEYATRFAFSFCAILLSQDTIYTEPDGKTTSRKALDQAFQKQCYELSRGFVLSNRIDQVDAHLVLGFFSCLLRRAFREYRIKRLIGIKYYTFILPLLLDIPLFDPQAFKKLPLPFTGTDEDNCENDQTQWKDWTRAHVASLTDPETFAADEWCGVTCNLNSYSWNNHLSFAGSDVLPKHEMSDREPQFEAPMQDIRFTVDELPADAPAQPMLDVCKADQRQDAGKLKRYRLRAAVVDTADDVSTLTGHMVSDGRIWLRQQYGNGLRYDWNCVMTPFGILGVLAPSTAGGRGSVSGIVWLWNKSWTDGARSRRGSEASQ